MAAFSMHALRATLPQASLACHSSSSLSSPSPRSVTVTRCAVSATSSSRRAASHCSSALLCPSFSGLRADGGNALSLSSLATTPLPLSLPSNGSRVFAMRHGRRIARLGRPADQRRALLRGLTTELLRHGRIKTTAARAKAMRKYVDHVITLAKNGSLHCRRQALGFLYDKTLVHAVFADAPERYAEREGGYTRVIRTMPRRGDNAPMAFIELV